MSNWETESRIGNLSNQHQGPYKRVLAVCSAGMLRSPTIAWVLGQEPYGYNCRSAGYNTGYALNIVDELLLRWADEIVCADTEHARFIEGEMQELGLRKPVFNLQLPDQYAYRDPELVRLIKERYDTALKEHDDEKK